MYSGQAILTTTSKFVFPSSNAKKERDAAGKTIQVASCRASRAARGGGGSTSALFPEGPGTQTHRTHPNHAYDSSNKKPIELYTFCLSISGSYGRVDPERPVKHYGMAKQSTASPTLFSLKSQHAGPQIKVQQWTQMIHASHYPKLA